MQLAAHWETEAQRQAAIAQHGDVAMLQKELEALQTESTTVKRLLLDEEAKVNLPSSGRPLRLDLFSNNSGFAGDLIFVEYKRGSLCLCTRSYAKHLRVEGDFPSVTYTRLDLMLTVS